MRRVLASVVGLAVVVGAWTGLAPSAVASSTWEFSSGSIQIREYFGGTGTISVTNFRVVNGSSASGGVGFSSGADNCSTSATGMTATFVTSGAPAPERCSGTVTFTIDEATGLLSVSADLKVGLSLFSGSGTLQGVAPVPTLTAISPNTAKEAGGGTAEIAGANLASATSVTIDSKAASIVAATDDKVVVSIPVAGSAPIGTAVDVTVTTRGGTATLPAAFTYTANAPSLTSVTPPCGVKAGETVTIVGNRMAAATAVTIGGQSVPFTVTRGDVIDGTITATLPALTGVQPVVVTTPAGSSSGLLSVSYNPCSALPALTMAVTSTTPAGGFATIAWSFPAGDPNLGNVRGLQYAPAISGPWANVGGTQSGTSGSFTVSGITKSASVVFIKVVNANPALGKDRLEFVAVKFATPPTPLPPNTGNAGSVPSPAQAAAASSTSTTGSGSTSSSGSTSGSDSGSGTPSDGAAVGAPCLAPVDSLYPPAFGTVGSQLVVVPGRPGDESPTAVTVTSGALPPGMGLDGSTGIVYGVPTAAGRYTATVRGRYADGTRANGTLDITIDNDAQTISYPVLVVGSVGQTVTTGPTTNAPVGSTYEIVCGKVPPGTTFDKKTGVISGTPTTVDYANPPLRIVERNSAGSAAASFLFVVSPAGVAQVSYPAHPHLVVRKATKIRPTIVDAGAVLYYKVVRGKLNRGLRMNHSTGVITGKPVARTGKRPHTVTVAGVRPDGSLIVAAPMRITVRKHR